MTTFFYYFFLLTTFSISIKVDWMISRRCKSSHSKLLCKVNWWEKKLEKPPRKHPSLGLLSQTYKPIVSKLDWKMLAHVCFLGNFPVFFQKRACLEHLSMAASNAGKSVLQFCPDSNEAVVLKHYKYFCFLRKLGDLFWFTIAFLRFFAVKRLSGEIEYWFLKDFRKDLVVVWNWRTD